MYVTELGLPMPINLQRLLFYGGLILTGSTVCHKTFKLKIMKQWRCSYVCWVVSINMVNSTISKPKSYLKFVMNYFLVLIIGTLEFWATHQDPHHRVDLGLPPTWVGGMLSWEDDQYYTINVLVGGTDPFEWLCRRNGQRSVVDRPCGQLKRRTEGTLLGVEGLAPKTLVPPNTSKR